MQKVRTANANEKSVNKVIEEEAQVGLKVRQMIFIPSEDEILILFESADRYPFDDNSEIPF